MQYCFSIRGKEVISAPNFRRNLDEEIEELVLLFRLLEKVSPVLSDTDSTMSLKAKNESFSVKSLYGLLIESEE